MTSTHRPLAVVLCLILLCATWPIASTVASDEQRAAQEEQTVQSIIASHRPLGCVRQGAEVTLKGQSFGSEAGSHTLVIRGPGDHAVACTIAGWSEDELTVVAPEDPRLEPGEVYVWELHDANGKRVSNSLPFEFCLQSQPRITSALPSDCVDPGATFTLFGSGFGASQRHRQLVLKMGAESLALEIKSWSDEQITAVMAEDPRLMPGSRFNIGLQNFVGDWLHDPSRMVQICE